jgi:quinol monooxygenase YgiN
MIILRQQMRSKPERTEEVWAALAAIVPGARATSGVISLDIARDLFDPDSFVATAVYEDAAAVERQESAPEVRAAMAIFRTRSRRRPIASSTTRRATRRSAEASRNRQRVDYPCRYPRFSVEGQALGTAIAPYESGRGHPTRYVS